MAKYLVIVESPAKVKTIKKFLGANYDVEASNGHVRDFPKSQFGIDVEHDFEPKYITIRGKGELLAKLRKAAKKADKIENPAKETAKKEKKPLKQKIKDSMNKKYIKNGSYSVVISAVFVVIVLVVNMIVGSLPSKYTEVDVSEQKLYSIGDDTKKFLKDLDKDVTIYQVVQSGSEDETIKKLLEKYEEGSDHIKVEQKDPVVNPKFASEYTTDDLASNSLIVVCGDRNKVINYNDMYSSSVDYNTWQQTTTGFDGEGQITSAIGYVTSEDHVHLIRTRRKRSGFQL